MAGDFFRDKTKKLHKSFLIIVVAFVICIAVAIGFLIGEKANENFTENGSLKTDSPINDGEVFFYSKATDEHQTPIIEKTAYFGTGFNSFLKTLKDQKWTDDYLCDRISFDFNGKIFYGGNWIYFSYNQKVIYYDHYFCDTDENVIKTIKEIEEKAVNYIRSENTKRVSYFGNTFFCTSLYNQP